MTARRLTRPGLLAVEVPGCRRLMLIESNAEGLVVRRTGKPIECHAITYDAIAKTVSGKPAKEWLR